MELVCLPLAACPRLFGRFSGCCIGSMAHCLHRGTLISLHGKGTLSGCCFVRQPQNPFRHGCRLYVPAWDAGVIAYGPSGLVHHAGAHRHCFRRWARPNGFHGTSSNICGAWHSRNTMSRSKRSPGSINGPVCTGRMKYCLWSCPLQIWRYSEKVIEFCVF